ncbi:hypothetical protein [Phytomonospora endophytica]|uniref:Uncharacterized protein n=1 Tax=Phytomonospora endophytica TaxID=714109 RepID=A0A841FSA6_9ACTN|nr:hypothetical protein [Phytomonospora endophytica]MBB6037693.1 hypothetical protein [Phytomonospora endophytica]GIG67780.1 hypothetical protein Pen01_40750 [Phytomonospora endophytica]
MNDTTPRTGTEEPAVVSAADMNTAIADGSAEYLSDVMTGFARYRDHWWVEEIERWLLVDDPGLVTFLNIHRQAVITRIGLIRRT